MAETTATKTAADILAYAKKWLRVSASSQEDEILQTIEAGVLDLQAAGVSADLSDSLILQAVKLYLKSHYGNNDRRADWAEAYEALKGSLSLTAKYGAKTEADDGQSD